MPSTRIGRESFRHNILQQDIPYPRIQASFTLLLVGVDTYSGQRSKICDLLSTTRGEGSCLLMWYHTMLF